MIPQNELRIGNWITFSPSGKAAKASERPVGITEIRNKSVIVDDNGLTLELFYESASTKPTPLSAEILENAGFKYGAVQGTVSFDNESNPDETTHYWDYDIKRTEFIDAHSLSLVKWGEQEYFTFQLERGFYRQRIKHLHQLQNLYFALTGEELDVKL